MSVDSIKLAFDDCWKGMASRDFAHAFSCYSDEAVHEDLGVEAIASGRAELDAFWGSWLDAMDNDDYSLVLTSSKFQPDGGFAIEWTMRARVDGNLRGIEGNGRKFEVRGATIGTIENGKITLWRDYYNGLPVLAQLGIGQIPGVPSSV